jgi:predicted nucleic acid-binding protein
VILVDTSAWIDFFRGRTPVARVVDELLENDDVAICGPVVTEIRRGLRSRADRTRVLPLLDGCRLLAEPDALWVEAGDLGFLLRRRGATVKTLDLLIATYALAHGTVISPSCSVRASGSRSPIGDDGADQRPRKSRTFDTMSSRRVATNCSNRSGSSNERSSTLFREDRSRRSGSPAP